RGPGPRRLFPAGRGRWPGRSALPDRLLRAGARGLRAPGARPQPRPERLPRHARRSRLDARRRHLQNEQNRLLRRAEPHAATLPRIHRLVLPEPRLLTRSTKETIHMAASQAGLGYGAQFYTGTSGLTPTYTGVAEIAT